MAFGPWLEVWPGVPECSWASGHQPGRQESQGLGWLPAKGQGESSVVV